MWTAYNITGLVSAIIFLLSLAGLSAQLRLVWERKRTAGTIRERPTDILSLNQFVSSFLAFFSFFLYGAALEEFNHYLVWPRLAACLLTLWVLFEMWADVPNRRTVAAFWGCAALLLAGPLALLSFPELQRMLRWFSQGLIVLATLVLAQGYTHQIVKIRQSRRTGAVSQRMHQFFLLKDLSTIAFALTMGWSKGWPLVLLSSVSAATKIATLWHFRWVRDAN